MILVDVCLKDAEKLRELAAYFDSLWVKSNGDFLRDVANRHEFLARAYLSSSVRYEHEMKEWIERGHTEDDKVAALKLGEGE